jgi:hypothetical protein
MSVFVYKGGAESKIPPEQLQEHLNAGWSVTDGEDEADTSPKPDAGPQGSNDDNWDPLEFIAEAPTKEEADTNGTGLLSNSEVRAAAEKAGIEGFKTKRIKALKVELGYEASE